MTSFDSTIGNEHFEGENFQEETGSFCNCCFCRFNAEQALRAQYFFDRPGPGGHGGHGGGHGGHGGHGGGHGGHGGHGGFPHGGFPHGGFPHGGGIFGPWGFPLPIPLPIPYPQYPQYQPYAPYPPLYISVDGTGAPVTYPAITNELA